MKRSILNEKDKTMQVLNEKALRTLVGGGGGMPPIIPPASQY